MEKQSDVHESVEIILIKGPSGSGKTLLSELLLSHYKSIRAVAVVFDAEQKRVVGGLGNAVHRVTSLRKLIDSNLFDFIIVTFIEHDGCGELPVTPFQVIRITK